MPSRLPVPAGELMLSRIREYGWIEIRSSTTRAPTRCTTDRNWQGKITSQEHTATTRPLSDRIGFIGTCTDVSAKVDAMALFGDHSVRYDATLRLLSTTETQKGLMPTTSLLKPLPIPVCLACGVERKIVRSERATRDYVIRSYRCPKCKTGFRIAERVSLPRKRRKNPTLSWSLSYSGLSTKGAAQPSSTWK